MIEYRSALLYTTCLTTQAVMNGSYLAMLAVAGSVGACCPTIQVISS